MNKYIVSAFLLCASMHSASHAMLYKKLLRVFPCAFRIGGIRQLLTARTMTTLSYEKTKEIDDIKSEIKTLSKQREYTLQVIAYERTERHLDYGDRRDIFSRKDMLICSGQKKLNDLDKKLSALNNKLAKLTDAH